MSSYQTGAVVWAVCLCASMLAVDAQQPTPPAQTPQLEAFLVQLQRAVAADDRNAVTTMMRYPITISIGGLRVPFADPASVLDRYDDIFNPPLREAIARASVETHLGAGIAIELSNGRARMTSIVVPDDLSRVDASSAGVRKQEPRRIAIRVGPRPTQISGTLLRDSTDMFIVYLPKGTLASVRLERVPVGAAVIRVVHTRTGAPLSARASSDARFVSARAPEDGDYRVEVRRTPSSDEEHLPYVLSFSLR